LHAFTFKRSFRNVLWTAVRNMARNKEAVVVTAVKDGGKSTGYGLDDRGVGVRALVG
jgi:hypothetical protein